MPGTNWKYPAATFNECLELISHINNRTSVSSIAEVAKTFYDLSNAATKSFSAKISSAKQFGLISASEDKICITLRGRWLLDEKCKDNWPLMKLTSFLSVPLYKELTKIYADKPLPSRLELRNVLEDEFNILHSVSYRAARCYLTSIEQIGLVDSHSLWTVNNAQREFLHEFKVTENSNKKNNVHSEKLSNEEISILRDYYTDKSNNNQREKTYQHVSYQCECGNRIMITFPVDVRKYELEIVRDMIEMLINRKYK